MYKKTAIINMNKYYLMLLGFIFFSCNNDNVFICTSNTIDIPTKSVSELIDDLNYKLKSNKEKLALKIDSNQLKVQNGKWVYEAFLNDLNLNELFYIQRKGENHMVITIRAKNGQDNVYVHSISNKTGKRIKDNHILISIYPESIGNEVLVDLCAIFKLVKKK